MHKKPTAVLIKVQPCCRQLFQVFQPYSNESQAARSDPSKLPTEVVHTVNKHIARTTDQWDEDICQSIVSQSETYRSQNGTLGEHVLSFARSSSGEEGTTPRTAEHWNSPARASHQAVAPRIQATNEPEESGRNPPARTTTALPAREATLGETRRIHR